ncbi:MAG: hypothetical protein V3S71_02770 [Acidobacteriota bacterium]
MLARYSGSCGACGEAIEIGTEIKKVKRAWEHATCPSAFGHGPGCYGECDGMYDCNAPAGVIEIRTSGGTFTRNAHGICEDAPCCGCCTF